MFHERGPPRQGRKRGHEHDSRDLFDCGPLLAFQVTTDRRCAEMPRAGSTDPALDQRVPRGAFFVPFRLEFPYFFMQTHFSDGLLQPTHTPLLISLPQVLHGSHPQVWQMVPSLSVHLHSCLPSFPPEAGVRPSTGVPWKIFFRPHSPNPARHNPSDINIMGVKTGPRGPATSASNEFVANVSSTPPVSIPNNHFTIMIAPSCQNDNPDRKPSVSASVRNACRCLSDLRTGVCPMAYSGTKGISYPSPQGDRTPPPSVATRNATRCAAGGEMIIFSCCFHT